MGFCPVITHGFDVSLGGVIAVDEFGFSVVIDVDVSVLVVVPLEVFVVFVDDYRPAA
jgi:hypothetical protein